MTISELPDLADSKVSGNQVTAAEWNTAAKVINFARNLLGRGTRTVYVSPSGNNANSGLSAGSPKATIQAAFDVLIEQGPALGGTWIVQLAAGTYTSPGQIIGLTSENYIVVRGPAASGGTPTAIIDPGPTATYGLWFGHGMRVKLQDIKIQNVLGGGTSSGVVLDYNCFAWAVNVHADNCTWAGINANISCRVLIEGGRYSSRYGIRLYGASSGTVGYSGIGATFEDCIAGVLYQGSSYGHVDDCTFTGCDIGLLAELRSHTTNYRNTYTGGNVGWQTGTFSSISTDDATTITGNTGARSRHSAGFAVGNDEPEHRYAIQYHDIPSTTGRFAFGYPSYVFPRVKHQFTGDTQAAMSLADVAPASLVVESGGNTVQALAADASGYTALWFADPTSPQAFEIRHQRSAGGTYFSFDGTFAYRLRSTDIAPAATDSKSLGRDVARWLNVFAKQFRPGTAGAAAPIWTSGTNTPEGAVAATVGSLYTREDGGAGTTLYVKESGTGNTGWIAK